MHSQKIMIPYESLINTEDSVNVNKMWINKYDIQSHVNYKFKIFVIYFKPSKIHFYQNYKVTDRKMFIFRSFDS